MVITAASIASSLGVTFGSFCRAAANRIGGPLAQQLSIANNFDGPRFGVWTEGILGPPCILFFNLGAAVV